MADTKTKNSTNSVVRALRVDHEGLTTLCDAVTDQADEVVRAIDVLLGMKGRLIVTGLGKSGHVGAKLAATFSSTGTPAYFLHPAEASHGDLGMVQPTDVMLALSWSGETRELSDVLGYAKRWDVPLIALTSNPTSTLGEAAHVTLVLPKVREACPHNLAPTTSTLLQMAMGDALAVALLEARGFTEESFHRFHPGGSLGAALKSLSEIMHKGGALPLVEADASVLAAISELSAKAMGIVGITENGTLTGVITDGDIRRYLERNASSTMQAALHETPARDLMTADSVTLTPGMLAGEALRILQERRISAAFVTDDGTVVGLVTMLRLLNRGTA